MNCLISNNQSEVFPQIGKTGTPALPIELDIAYAFDSLGSWDGITYLNYCSD